MYRFVQLGRARRLGTCDHLPRDRTKKPRVLVYHVDGLAYGGTERFLQTVARHLPKDSYDVLFMHASGPDAPRATYMADAAVEWVPFTHTGIDGRPPHAVRGMRPHLFDVLRERDVDVLVTSGPGYATHPVANVTRLPVVYVSVFGWVNPQRNLIPVVISDELAVRFREELGPRRAVHVVPIPSEGPDAGARDRGLALRRRLGVPDGAFVVGRVGRPSPAIWDPIGLAAFARAVQRVPSLHYLILAPPEPCREYVRRHGIPNVHFLDPTGDEKEVWAFHGALDALAHWRADGETFGLNIVESMLMGNPIVTHRSRTWNAHLEYLDGSFAFVAGPTDVDAYASALETLARDPERARAMGRRARETASRRFLAAPVTERFRRVLDEALAQVR